MNVIIFSLTILLMYGIISYAYKAWKKADLKQKMSDLEEVETDYENVKIYKKTHKGNINKKREVIEDFKKE